MTTRVPHVLRALHDGVTSVVSRYATEQLRSLEPGFDDVWRITDAIPGWFHEVNAAAMYHVLREMRPQRVVEIGSFMGRSTVFFAETLRGLGLNARVSAIDAHSGDRQQREGFGASEIPTYEMFRTYVAGAGVDDIIDPVVATSSEAAVGWSDSFEFLFIDGWHGYDAVLADGRQWAASLPSHGVVVFDDATNYREVRDAIDTLHREGSITEWGQFFGQVYASRRETPPPAVARILRIGRNEMIRRRFAQRVRPRRSHD